MLEGGLRILNDKGSCHPVKNMASTSSIVSDRPFNVKGHLVACNCCGHRRFHKAMSCIYPVSILRETYTSTQQLALQ